VADAAARGFAVGGLKGMRENMLSLQKKMLERGLGPAYDLAATCALLGKKAEALRYLQAAYEKREVGLLYLGRNQNSNILRDDPIYKEITERVGERLSTPTRP
jgi:hypothetical protein